LSRCVAYEAPRNLPCPGRAVGLTSGMDVLQLDPTNATHVRQFREIRLCALHTDPAAFDSTYERELAFSDAAWRGHLASFAGHPGAVLAAYTAATTGGAPPLAQGRTRLLHPSASSALTSLSPQTRRSGACGWRPRVDGGALRQNSSTTLRPGQPNLVRIPRPCGYTARTLRRRRSTTAVATNSSNRMTSPQMSPMHVAQRSACGHASHRRELLYAVVP